MSRPAAAIVTPKSALTSSSSPMMTNSVTPMPKAPAVRA
jgi:hypothetical protein